MAASAQRPCTTINGKSVMEERSAVGRPQAILMTIPVPCACLFLFGFQSSVSLLRVKKKNAYKEIVMLFDSSVIY